ncbi:MAG: citrate lyase acyl carrier protein [Oscillospiraceae bacterium]
MMNLKKPAVAGTLESSDIQVTLRPNPGKGLEIELQSIVKAQFGDAILETVHAVLADFDVDDAIVELNDKGALDRVIKSRMQTAICRAAEIQYDWTKEDAHGA